MARAFWWTAPGRGELRAEPLGTDGMLVRARFGALSRGTERLVALGEVPDALAASMACPSMAGGFPFPVKYGYCVVGEVEEGPAGLLGRTVFALHPHQERFRVPAAQVTVVPPTIPPERAVLLANLETALNGAWDAPLLAGMRVAVLGAGAVGCLFARLARRTPGVEVTLADLDPARAELAAALDLPFAAPEALGGRHDLVVEATGRPEALAQALDLAGPEATILVLSWYGQRTAPLPLGGAFHPLRLKLVGSQVGQVAPLMRPRVDHAERRARAVALLDDPALDALLGPALAFDELPAQALARLTDGTDARVPLIRYQADDAGFDP